MTNSSCGLYQQLLKTNSEATKKNIDLKQSIHKFHSAILSACPTKNLPNMDDLGKTPVLARTAQPMMVPTAAALKMGVGFPLNNIPAGRTDRVLSNHAKPDSLMLNECGICRQKRDQHMLAKCDTCHLFYHLNCLNPPLTRLPKKSKLYGWQCSECDKSSDSEVEEVKTPRRSKSRYSREALRSDVEQHEVGASITPKLIIKPVERAPQVALFATSASSPSKRAPDDDMATNQNPVVEMNGFSLDNGIGGHKSKKRRREKHRNRYSPDMGGPIFKEHKRKRKKKSFDLDEPVIHPRITIKVKFLFS